MNKLFHVVLVKHVISDPVVVVNRLWHNWFHIEIFHNNCSCWSGINIMHESVYFFFQDIPLQCWWCICTNYLNWLHVIWTAKTHIYIASNWSDEYFWNSITFMPVFTYAAKPCGGCELLLEIWSFLIIQEKPCIINSILLSVFIRHVSHSITMLLANMLWFDVFLKCKCKEHVVSWKSL